ncbi:flagellar hook protein FlgE [Sulfitobacter sp. CW3]|uniref:flagellar hook protein FlgE n=1 Tax=Sulfitobacter sp. CW3 TaxID=2861965 RepID=UPI001C5F66D4|nr:flagellar hook-basal body complex protein [Sulfitobacter sp. CW3]MBW4962653.1 flagellar hook-basal body complex protein [Sulfitobacter sp. CW3]|tara:strand:+ start:188852 stop:190210 length:1359 start_codon:yes stop_codon:yes gene_type:complete
MTISSSLNAGVAGLQANATRLAAVSDNIANSSTYGYKRVVTDFNSLVLSDGISGYTAGGVRASSNRLVSESGAVISTSNSTDLAVRGRGFLPVTTKSAFEADPNGDSSGQMMLATTGSFRLDSDGLLTTETGLLLLGWPANQDGSVPNFPRDTNDGLSPVQFALSLSGDPTTKVNMSLNLPATATEANGSGESQVLSIEYFDNLGTSKSISMEFAPTVPASGASNEWTAILTDSAQGGAVVGEYVITFDDSRTSGGTIGSVTTVSGGGYDPVTGAMIINAASGPIEFNIGAVNSGTGLSQLSDSFAPIALTKDGSPVGNMASVEVDANGYVNVLYDNGLRKTIYQIPLVDLPNAEGLVSLDAQTYMISPESGAYFLWDAGDGPTGDIKSYAREESTTDVATELTTMIRTQRAYSSNAKVIQTVELSFAVLMSLPVEIALCVADRSLLMERRV